MSRRWLAAVVLLFCLPLFAGLGRTDLQTDEAIYSYAVDRILETGHWLQPKSSPSDTVVFLEKPPLKFWIVAAGIRSGLLPPNEFGMRFWDALAGSAGFVYVFAIGSLLAGPLCGFLAVLLLFVHWPLIFEHGLRTNNMEAPLFLCYAGGLYHFFRYARAPAGRSRALSAAATGLLFALGFMTKFVAALFLPVVILLAALLVPHTRRLVLRDWRTWTAIAVAVAAVCAPWFVYAQLLFGRQLWDTMLGAHVYTRFTGYLDPSHVQPWYFYVTTLYRRLADSESAAVVLVGLGVLLVQAIRRRSLEEIAILLWAVFPIAAISLGTSKLYHYVYPFLPPLTLAAAYLAVLVLTLAPAPVRRLLDRCERFVAARLPRFSAAMSKPWIGRTAMAVVWIATGIAVAATVLGVVELTIGERVIFKSSGTLRPAVVIVAAAIVGQQTRRIVPLVVIVAVLGLIPVWHYVDTLPRLFEDRHPLRSLRNCILGVQAQAGESAAGLSVDAPNLAMQHPIYYYLRRVEPWTRQDAPDAARFFRSLEPDQTGARPILVSDARYEEYLRHDGEQRLRAAAVPLFDYHLMLPGSYASCAADAHAERRD